MSIIQALKRKYARKQEFKEYQKGTEKKKEYRSYLNSYLSNPKHKAKDTQSYAQWYKDKYGKYEKKKNGTMTRTGNGKTENGKPVGGTAREVYERNVDKKTRDKLGI
jgi:hypothetical protein